MFTVILFLAGAFTVQRVVAARQAAPGGGAATNVPPAGFEVSCPSEISPGNYGEWATPCDVQTYSGPEPPEPWGGQGCAGAGADGKPSQICRILPDGTPLYEYAIDGIPYAEREPGVYQTYFAGVPLDFPPRLKNGMVGWAQGTSGDPVWQKGVAATDISNSPAPFVWHEPSTSPAGFLNPDSGHVYPMQLVDGKWRQSKSVGPYYRPQHGFPYVPKPFKLGDTLNFINSLQKFACTALSTGLTVGSSILKSDVAKGLLPKSAAVSANAAHKVATGFYESACGGK